MNRMIKQNIKITITRFLAFLSLIAIIFAHLALTDIYHNKEPDLTAEWIAVRVAFFIIVLFVISVLVTLKKI